jgi:hypothetical protein
MSKVEPTEFINDRYAAMEKRLKVCRVAGRPFCATKPFRAGSLPSETLHSPLHVLPPSDTDRAEAPEPAPDPRREGEFCGLDLGGCWVSNFWANSDNAGPLQPPSLQIVYGHLEEPETQELERGVSYLKLRPGEF